MLEANHFNPSTVPRFFGQTPEESDSEQRPDSNSVNNQVHSPARNSPQQEENYEACPHCSRTFFAGRLKLHLKNCKDNKPQQKAVKAKTLNERSQEDNDLTSHVVTMESQAYQSKMNSHYRSPSVPAREAGGSKPEYNVATEESVDGDDAADTRERTKAEDGRVGCFSCGRFFHEDRVGKHEKACKKSSKKRPVFDIAQQRAIVEPGAVIKKNSAEAAKIKKVVVQKEKGPVDAPKKEIHVGKEETNKKTPAWKAQHENFIENIRFNRKLKQMEARGEDTSNLVVPTIVNDTYVSCTYCFRKFAPATAERHIPKCKNTFNRPKPPKHLQLEKLEDFEKMDRSKSQISPKKSGASIRKSPEIEVKEPVSPAKSSMKDKNGSYRSPNFDVEVEEKSQDNGSPKGNAKLPQFSSSRIENNSNVKKLPSLDQGKKVTILPEIKRQEMAENSMYGYELNLSGKKARDLRSQSPPGAKKVFTEPMPKKETLLQHYQSLFIRASHYAAVECPYCQRKFAQSASERHIPVCKSLGNRNMKKNGEVNSAEKKRPKMYFTGFDMKLESIDSGHPRSSHNGSHSTGYDHFFGAKRNKKTDRRLMPLSLKKPDSDSKEIIQAKSPLPQAPKFFASVNHFCTSCGTKLAKAHNFCGNCGHKKNEV